LKFVVVYNYLFLDKETLWKLMNLTNVEDLILAINQHLSKNKQIRLYLLRLAINKEHFFGQLRNFI